MSDMLIDTDKAIRETCSQYKTVVEATPIIPDDALAQEMTNMEKQIFDQAVKINTLKKYATGLADKTMETTVVNRENNRIKLQEYLNNQQAKVMKGVKKLSNVKDISINLKYPVKMVKMLMDIVAKSDTIPHKTKIDTVKKLKTLVDNDTTLKRAIVDIPYVKKSAMTIGRVNQKELESMLKVESVMDRLKQDMIVEIKSGHLKGEKARIMRINPTKEEVTVEIMDTAVKMPITLKAENINIIQQ